MYSRVINSVIQEENIKKMNNLMGYAAEIGCEHFVNEAIKCGANDWNHGMVKAAAGGHVELVKLFVAKGANSWLASKYEAIRNNHRNLIRYFAEIDREDMIFIQSLIAMENNVHFKI